MKEYAGAKRRLCAERFIPAFGDHAKELRFFDGTVALFDDDPAVFCHVKIRPANVDFLVLFDLRESGKEVVLALLSAACLQQAADGKEQDERGEGQRRLRRALAHG